MIAQQLMPPAAAFQLDRATPRLFRFDGDLSVAPVGAMLDDPRSAVPTDLDGDGDLDLAAVHFDLAGVCHGS